GAIPLSGSVTQAFRPVLAAPNHKKTGLKARATFVERPPGCVKNICEPRFSVCIGGSNGLSFLTSEGLHTSGDFFTRIIMKPRLPVLLAMAAAICVMVSLIVAERPHVY